MDAFRKLFKRAKAEVDRNSEERRKDLLKQVKKMKKPELAETLKYLKMDDSGKVADLRERLTTFVEDSILVPESSSQGEAAGHDDKETRVAVSKVPAPGSRVAVSKVPDPGSRVEVPEETATSRGYRKKKWRITDPAEIAPNYYHEELFRANFPLVKIFKVGEGKRMPVKDKFEVCSLDRNDWRERTKMARLHWRQRLCKVDRIYYAPSNERQAFPHHMAFVEDMADFTLPSSKVVQKVQLLRKRKREPELTLSDEGGGERFGCFRIKPEAEDIEGVLGRKTSSRNEGERVLIEGSASLFDDLQEHEDVATGFADAVLFVDDKRALSSASSDAVVNTERTAGILERKFAEDKSKLAAPFQGAYYGAKYAMVNIQNGHGTPVYIITMTASLWSYAILVPEGFALVKGGEMDPQSMEAFVRHQSITGVADNSLSSLQKLLADGTLFYQRNYREKPHATYRDDPMLVGRLYLMNDWFRLPTTELGGFSTDGAERLFDGLMRLILGDCVLEMRAEEIAERVQVNEMINAEISNSL